MMPSRAASCSHAFLAVAIVSVIAFDTNAFGEQSTSAPPMKTQWDRVYTVAQALRGEELFAAACVSCHPIDRGAARSRTNPSLNNPDFWANWNGLTLEQLSERIRISMPATAPGTLEREQVADILAFLLELEGAQAGSTVLPATIAELRKIRFADPAPPAFAR